VISKEWDCTEIRDLYPNSSYLEIRSSSKFSAFKKLALLVREPDISRDSKKHFTRKPWRLKAENFVSIE
jgi:hypothetical protein